MWYWFLIAGLFGGICGGMGLGGGTLLIPILTILLSVDQHLAQGLNLLVFVPTGIVALIIHAKNKLLDYKMCLFVAIPALASAIICSIYVKDIKGELLGKIFGGFLIMIAVYELIVAIKTSVEKHKSKNEYKFII